MLRRHAGGSTSAVGWLSAVNLLQVVLGFATSPILAHTLGPSGRGDLAAITVVIATAPWFAELGIATFLTRESAGRDVSDGSLLGSAAPIGLGFACILAVAAGPIAGLFAHGRSDVDILIKVGLWILPTTVLFGYMTSLGAAHGKWGLYVSTKLISTLVTTGGVIGLAIAGHLTVETAGIAYIAATFASGLIWLPALLRSLPWSVSAPIARTGLSFGLRNWLSTLAAQGNSQLDQLLMAGLLSAHILGWYALAVTLSGIPGVLVGPVSTVITPKTAGGDTVSVALACRCTLVVATLASAVVGVGSWLLVAPVFGHGFTPAIPMIAILLLGTVVFAPAVILNAALAGAGDANSGLISQVAGLAVTLPALAVLLPTLDGIGASIASVLGYSAASGVSLWRAKQRFGMPVSRFLVPVRDDVRVARSVGAGVASRVVHRTVRSSPE